MKKIAMILFLFSLVVSCERDDNKYKCDIGFITYQATIGYDYSSALDSLLKMDILLPDAPYVIEPEQIRVEYPIDDRDFYMISFKDKPNGINLQSPMDVIDTKGCWYKIIWGED